MLKPSVGLMPMISSPFSFLRIVVFPALSRPLEEIVQRGDRSGKLGAVQEENAHFLLFLAVFTNDR